jgi:ribosome-binding ATPase YchF (GTP1/OBG family)
MKASYQGQRDRCRFREGFIKSDIYDYTDIDQYGSETVLREKSLIRSEGKEYIVKDVCHFKFNVFWL